MGRPRKITEINDTQVEEQTETEVDQDQSPSLSDQPESPIDEVSSESGNSDEEKPGENQGEEIEEEPVQIASKQFLKILREELKKEKISETVYKAFLASVPKVDWEKNYRMIWETTFRRPPAKK